LSVFLSKSKFARIVNIGRKFKFIVKTLTFVMITTHSSQTGVFSCYIFFGL